MVRNTVLLLGFSLLLTASCFGESLKWTLDEKAQLTSIIVLSAIDCYQTDYLTVQHAAAGYKEVNPLTHSLFGNSVHWHELALLKVALMGPVIYYGLHKSPKTHAQRKIGLAVLNGFMLMPVINNENVSGGLVFKKLF